MEKSTWAHKALGVALQWPFPWMFMHTFSIPFGWTAIWGCIWATGLIGGQVVPIGILCVWFCAMIVPFFLRVYFSMKRDLLVDLIDIMDILSATALVETCCIYDTLPGRPLFLWMYDTWLHNASWILLFQMGVHHTKLFVNKDGIRANFGRLQETTNRAHIMMPVIVRDD